MSLPPAQQEVSEHPHAGTVTAPTDKNAQAADIDRKILLYGIIQAFRQDRMPDNVQINNALSYLRDTELIDVHKLSSDGRKLVQDCREIVETARLIVKQKNADELLQNFVWHTRDVDAENTKVAGEGAPQVDRGKLTEDGRHAVRHLRTLLSLVLTNSEIRKVLSDFTVIGRDLLARGASKAAEALRPSNQEIAVLDRPAEFAPPGGYPRPGESEVELIKGKASEGEAIGEGKQEVRSEKKSRQKGKEAAVPQDTTGESSERESSTEESDGVFKLVKERLGLSTDKKKWAGDKFEKGRQFMMDEYFPPERRDQFIYRGKRVIVECQKQDNYRDAMSWFLSIAEEYAEFGQSAQEKGKERVSKLINDPHLRQTFSELRQLLERFANGKSMHVIFDSIGAINDDVHRDEEFRAWFQHLHGFVRKLLLEEGYVLGENCSREGRDIRESGRKFWDQKYRGHFEEVLSSMGDWFSAMGEDPLNKQFGEDWARLTRNLLFDSEGSLKFKSDLWMDIRRVIVPTLVEKVGYLPIPRIEYSDAALDLVLENLTLQGSNLFPNIVTVVTHNYVKFSPYHGISDEHHHEFTFTLEQIQADMRDVAFFFHKKTGFPKVVDSGLADVVLGGSGLTAIIHLVSAGKDRTSVFKVKDVHVKVSSLKFSIRDSKHDLLYRTLKPLASGLVKRQIKKAIAGAIKTGMEYLDGQLVSVRDKMEEAKSSDETNRMHVLQELFKRHKEEQRTSESKTQFKVVSSMRSSVIDTGTPSGWVNRVSESEAAAVTGKDWRSQAFTMV